MLLFFCFLFFGFGDFDAGGTDGAGTHFITPYAFFKDRSWGLFVSAYHFYSFMQVCIKGLTFGCYRHDAVVC